MAAVRCRNFEEVEEEALDICKIVFHLQTVYFQEKRTGILGLWFIVLSGFIGSVGSKDNIVSI